MRVLHDHHDRTSRRQALEEREEPRADLRHPVPPSIPGLVAEPEREAQQVDDLLRPLRGATAAHEFFEARLQLLGWRVRGLPDLLQEDLGDRGERDVLLERAGPAGQHLGRVGETRQELLDHPALADPRLAEQRDHVPPTRLLSALEGLDQQAKLPPAIHEGDGPPGGARRQGDDRPGRQGTLEPLGHDLHALAVLDVVLREEPRRLPDQHGARLGGLLEPGRRVHHRPVQQSGLRAFASDGHPSGVHSDPALEGEGQQEALAQLGHPLHDGQPRPDGPDRVVVVGMRDAEHTDHGVAGEVVRAPPKRFQLLGDRLVEGRDDLAVALRVDLCGQPGRADQVGEDHGDDLAFLRRRGPDGERAVRTELRVLGERFAATNAGRPDHPAKHTRGW